MPVYQYACTDCGERLEVRQSFTDDALSDCPTCAGRLRKVLSAVGVVFKGSGFYRTDSRKETADATSSAGAAKAPSESPKGKETSPSGESSTPKPKESGSSPASSSGPSDKGRAA